MPTKLTEETWKKVQDADAYAILNAPFDEQLTYIASLGGKLNHHVQNINILSDEDLEKTIKNATVILKNAQAILDDMGDEEFEIDGEVDKFASRSANKLRLIGNCIGILPFRKASAENRDLAARACVIVKNKDLALTDMTTQDPMRLERMVQAFINLTEFAPKENHGDQRYQMGQSRRFISCVAEPEGAFTLQFECTVTRRDELEIGGLPVIYPEVPETYQRAEEDKVHCRIITLDDRDADPISLTFEALEPLREGDYGRAIVTVTVPEHTESISFFPCLGGLRADFDSEFYTIVTDIIAEAKQEAELESKPSSSP